MDQVRELREARGWTQQHLADAAGLSLRTVQRIEAGEVAPSKESLLALSGAFDVEPRHLEDIDYLERVGGATIVIARDADEADLESIHAALNGSGVAGSYLVTNMDVTVGEGPDEGPHVVIERDDPEFLPGCKINVIKDHFQVPCVMRLDSRTRTVTRLGMLLLDFSEEEFGALTVENFDAPTEWGHPVSEATKIYVDGELWDGKDHPVTMVYDAVLLRGPHEVIYGAAAAGKVPKHWVLIPTDPTSTPATG
jgi:transcriptional regulator with XRE-family HTH domain